MGMQFVSFNFLNFFAGKKGFFIEVKIQIFRIKLETR
jgi:hypothetical protein